MKNEQVLPIIVIILTILRQSSCEKLPHQILNKTTQQTVSEDYRMTIDYFSEDFHGDKNCADKRKMKKLKQNYPDHCVALSTAEYNNKESAFTSCMNDLVRKLQKKCQTYDAEGIKSSGNITYCMQRGISECCFSRAECYTKNQALLKGEDEALTQYVKYGLDTMADFIAINKKYKVCFKTQEFDTGICEAECKKLKNSEFAKNCSKKVDGRTGVFKCCIVSDNKGCDICNYCCILPVCTRVKDGQNINQFDTQTIQKTNTTNKTKPDEQNIIEAKADYVHEDYFCVPKPFKRGKAFYYYNMTEYIAANNIEEMKILEKIVVPTFENYFLGLYNLKYRLMFTHENETLLKTLADNHGEDYCFKLHKHQGKRSKCVKKCKQLKTKTFAKECNKKKNSLFKCCIQTKNPGEDEIVQMKTMKTLNETLQRPCRNGKCYYCCLTVFCSTLHDGKINNILRTDISGDDESKEADSEDDENEDYGFESEPEANESPVNECMNPNNNLPEYWPRYNIKEYNAAYTEDMMCRVSLEWDKHVTIPKKMRRKLPTKQKINKKCDGIKKKRNKRKYSKKKYQNKRKKNKKYKKRNKMKRKQKKRKKKYVKRKSKGKTKGKRKKI